MKRIVLYYPQQRDDRDRPPHSTGREEMPLALLAIAAWPRRDGYEVVIVDGTRCDAAEAHRKVLEACEGALLFATTGILGYQVTDGYRCTREVRARFPSLPCFVGGWFASVAPELYLATGLFDAVAIGQGEITFRELVQAVDSGADLEGVDGLALMRDGQVVFNAPRRVVSWSDLLPCAWDLLDFEEYRRPQLDPRTRLEMDHAYGPTQPQVEIAYYSAFGCPVQCTFCCSPEFSGLRWKAMPAERMLDDIQELQERWGFDGVSFYDANFGVAEKRVREFAQGVIDRGLRFRYFNYLQAASILGYQQSTLDLLQESGLYGCVLGAEAGTDEMMVKLKKPTRGEDNIEAALELDRRGISPKMTYIIGYPGESRASMLATIDQARRASVACPNARPEVWPYRPIPGAEDFRRALDEGYEPPGDLEGWGRIGDYWNEEPWPGRIPPEVRRARALFMHFSSLAQGRVRQRVGFFERRARARMKRGDYHLGGLEARAFHLFDRTTRRFLAPEHPRLA